METSDELPGKADVGEEHAQSYVGLRGRELVSWALARGEDCLDVVGGQQKQYFEAVARGAGVEWPDGFFKSSVERLMDH